jgi:hypothetical protein
MRVSQEAKPMRPMKRTNVYLTEKQLQRLRNQADKERVAVAEIIRRAVEVYLVWNDPAYQSSSVEAKIAPQMCYTEGELSVKSQGR